MSRVAAVMLMIVVMFGAALGPVTKAQEIPQGLSEGGAESKLRTQKNEWTVGIVGGLLSGTYMRFADEIAKVVDDGDNMRVLPIVSHGAASNIDDLLYVRGIDAAITQADAFEYFRTVRKTPNLENRINYILRLPIAEVHLLARRDIRRIEDLRGKKVSFGPVGAGSSLTGTIIFQRLGIEVDPVYLNAPVSLQKVQSGEVAAMVRVIGKPITFFSRIPADAGLHLVPIPFSGKFDDYYTLGEFTPSDYPTLVPKDGRTDTIAVPTVLAVYNWWKKDRDRFRKVERLVQRLFQNWDRLQNPPYHPKWRDANLSATVPGWKRFPVAESLLQEMAEGPARPVPLSREFQAFLDKSSPSSVPRNPAEREALFREFLKWRAQR